MPIVDLPAEPLNVDLDQIGHRIERVVPDVFGDIGAADHVALATGQVIEGGAGVRDALVEFPTKGNSLGDKIVPTDPLMYRFYEILCVYGTTLKEVIQEKFGDGIMSAIDFKLTVDKVKGDKGEDRMVVTMNGKFLAHVVQER